MEPTGDGRREGKGESTGRKRERREVLGLEKVPDVAMTAGGLAALLSHPCPAAPSPHILASPPSHGVTWAQESSGQVRDTSCHSWGTHSPVFSHGNTGPRAASFPLNSQIKRRDNGASGRLWWVGLGTQASF